MANCDGNAAQNFFWLKENYEQIYERMTGVRENEDAERRCATQKLLSLCPTDVADITMAPSRLDEKTMQLDLQWLSENYKKMYDELNKIQMEQLDELVKDYPEYLQENDPLSPLDCAVPFFPDRKDRRRETEYCRHLVNFLNDKSLGQKLLGALVTLAGIEDKKQPFIINSASNEEFCRKGNSTVRLDIVIHCEGHKKVIIEAKIDSKEGSGQTPKYAGNETYSACNCSYIFLTLKGDIAEDNKFKSVSWFDMAASFYAAVKSTNIQCAQLPYFKIWLGSIVKELYELDFNSENAAQFKCFIKNEKYYGDK